MQIPNITFESAVEWAGSQSDLARVLDITPSAVSQWREDGLPEGRIWQLVVLGCPAIEQAEEARQ